jgi:hypothetical protein
LQITGSPQPQNVHTPTTIKPPATGLRWIGRAVKSGAETVLPARMPAYETLDPGVRAEAARRGLGKTIDAPQSTADVYGLQPDDPVTLVISGPLANLEAALTQTGWTPVSPRNAVNDVRMGLAVVFKVGNGADAPVFTRYLNGKTSVAAYTKNADHARGRDHLRIYALAADAQTGAPRWAITATRDIAVTLEVHTPLAKTGKSSLSANHATDPHIDAERDLIMHDLLAADAVTDWEVVEGRRTHSVPGKESGVVIGGYYETDGQVYAVTLAPRVVAKSRAAQ